jgi:hypothetical protein
MRTIDDMIDSAAMLDSGKHDHVLTPRFVGRRVSVHEDLVPCLMEHQATTHLCGRMSQRLVGRPPVPAGFFNETCDDAMYAYNLNTLIDRIVAKKGKSKRGGKTDWMFRCHGDHVRAVVGENYPAFGLDGMFENRTLLEAMHRIAFSQPQHTVVRPFVSRDRVICKVIFKDVRDGAEHYGLGAAFSNSEIGDGLFEVYGLIQRHSCTNSIVIDQGMRYKHVGGVGKFHAALSELIVSMGEAGKSAAEWLERMIFAKTIEIPDIGAMIDGVAKGYGWDDVVKLEMGIGTEGRSTLGGLVNGITWAAHRVYGDKPELMFELEQAAATILKQGIDRHEKARRRLDAVEYVPVPRQRVAA